MRPKVLAIIDTGIIGGPGKGLFMLIRHIPAGLAEITACCIRYRRKVSTAFIEEALRLKIDLKLLQENFRFDPRIFTQATDLLKEGGYNLIQSHNYKSHLLAFVLSKASGIPWVAWAHGWTGEDWKVKFYHSLDLLVLRYADAVITVSPPLLEKISSIRKTGKLTAIIPNAIEPVQAEPGDTTRAEIRRRYMINEQDFVAGCFGRLSKEKGQSVLLEALAAVPARKNIKVIFCGDGPDGTALKELAEKLHISNNVIFTGYQKDLRKFFKAIDLLILPSLSEGLPNVVLEAMAVGVPVLSTNVGALGEIITPELQNGWLVSSNDAGALAQKLSELIRAPAELRRAADSALSALFPRFSPELRARKVLSVYEQVLRQ